MAQGQVNNPLYQQYLQALAQQRQQQSQQPRQVFNADTLLYESMAQQPAQQQSSPMSSGISALAELLKPSATQTWGGLAGDTPVASAMGGGELTAAGEVVGAPGMFSVGNIGAAGNGILPLAGLAGAYDLFRNKRSGGRGALQGAASGAALGSYFGPVGIGGGAALGAGAGYFGNLGDKDQWKKEQSAVSKLAKKGVTGWDQYAAAQPKLTKGRSKQELVDEAKATGGNVKFAESRNESDLRPEDIWGYSAFGEKYGNDWFGKFSEADRRQKAKEALDAGAVNEGKGQITIDWNKIKPMTPATPALPTTTARVIPYSNKPITSVTPVSKYPKAKK
jgi:hypothetical protein